MPVVKLVQLAELIVRQFKSCLRSCDVSVLSGGISIKLATNNFCEWELMKRISRSKVKVIARPNALLHFNGVVSRLTGSYYIELAGNVFLHIVYCILYCIVKKPAV